VDIGVLHWIVLCQLAMIAVELRIFCGFVMVMAMVKMLISSVDVANPWIMPKDPMRCAIGANHRVNHPYVNSWMKRMQRRQSV
jgi:hypothetical protein